jgi:hypothetical protein
MMVTYSHLLEDIGGDAVGGLDEAFGQTGCSTVALMKPDRKAGPRVLLQMRGDRRGSNPRPSEPQI